MAAWGEAFGRALAPPAVVAISGELGAGKTTLVRAVARGLGVREPVTSPTFALVHRYDGTAGAIYHVDAYRLKPADAADLGLDDMLADPTAVVLIEWPERLGPHAPLPTHHLSLSWAAGGARRLLQVA